VAGADESGSTSTFVRAIVVCSGETFAQTFAHLVKCELILDDLR
jgi:hypothetical protein